MSKTQTVLGLTAMTNLDSWSKDERLNDYTPGIAPCRGLKLHEAGVLLLLDGKPGALLVPWSKIRHAWLSEEDDGAGGAPGEPRKAEGNAPKVKR